MNLRSHHKGATGRVQIGDQLLPVLCHSQLGQDIPNDVAHQMLNLLSSVALELCILLLLCILQK